MKIYLLEPRSAPLDQLTLQLNYVYMKKYTCYAAGDKAAQLSRESLKKFSSERFLIIY